MRRFVILILTIITTLCLTSCGSNQKIRKYSNEVSFEEFSLSFWKAYEDSIINTYTESDFKFELSRDNHSSTSSKLKLNDEFDFDNQIYFRDSFEVVKNKEITECGYFYELDGKCYFKEKGSNKGYESVFHRSLNRILRDAKSYISNFERVVFPGSTYYVDENVFTVLTNSDESYYSINQLIIKESSITYIRNVKQTNNGETTTDDLYVSLVLTDVKINVEKN